MLRQAPRGPEVLMGVRASGHRFMPNRLVFPGGAVDPEDAVTPAASEPRADMLALLGLSAPPRLARAIAMAAARELSEETGLSLGTPPHLDGLDYLCRAITPPEQPIRFNARFLIAPGDRVEGRVQDSRELHGLRFYPVEEALRTDMMLVTREVLTRLLAWLDLTEAARRTMRRTDVFRQRRWGRERIHRPGVSSGTAAQ